MKITPANLETIGFKQEKPNLFILRYIEIFHLQKNVDNSYDLFVPGYPLKFLVSTMENVLTGCIDQSIQIGKIKQKKEIINILGLS